MSPQEKLPVQLDCEKISAAQFRLQLKVQSELCYFDGHFPETPVLPGVVQLHWAEAFARDLFGPLLPELASFQRLEAVKFQQLIRPEQEVSLDLEYVADKNKMYFRFYHQDTQFSTGRFVYG